MHKFVLTFESVDEILKCAMKTIEKTLTLFSIISISSNLQTLYFDVALGIRESDNKISQLGVWIPFARTLLSFVSNLTFFPGGTGGHLGQLFLGMCRWPLSLRAPTPL